MFDLVNLKFSSSANQPKNKFKLSFLVLIVFILSIETFAQWSKQSPVPTHLDVRGVGAPTADRVFIATDDDFFDESGALFESNDGGITWVQRNLPVSLHEAFNGLFFLNNQYGWAFGNDNYRTTDGGSTWTQLPFLGSTYYMKFYSQSFGLATGNFDRYISQDGGDSWSPSPNDIFAFDFVDDLNGLGVSETGIYKTTDGGINFNQVHSGNAKSVVYLSPTAAAAISDGIFIYSTDGGSTWNNSVSADNKFNLTAVSSTVVFAWGRTGIFPNYDDSILHSSDGGQTWTNLGEVFSDGIFAVTVVNPQNIVVADFSGNMYHSSDGGAAWNPTFTSLGQMPGYLSSASPHFATEQVGYFGYGNGFVIKTTDSGQSWSQISSGTGESLHDIARFPNGNMIAVGDNGTVLTSDGNSPWVQQSLSVSKPITAVHTINDNDVVMVDEDGQLYISSNSGITWQASGTIPDAFLDAKDLHFTSLLNGWVVGDGSMDKSLFHTSDGGNNWTAATGFGGYYLAVDFEGNNGWIQNVGGRFYRTTDNGATWNMGELPDDTYSIRDIDFYDENIGYAVGLFGYAARSEDGGETWERLTMPNTDDGFTDIYLLGPNELWLSTNDDVAYYSANGGINWAVLEIGSTGFGSFSSITASSDGDAWTVGDQGYIQKFTGPPPPPPNIPPNAYFEYSDISLTVTFTDLSTDPDGAIVSWNWTFGDGSGSTDQNPAHTYDSSGIYQVKLTVTDDDGDSSTSTQSIPVQQVGGTFGDFTEVSPLDSLFVTPHDEDFWVATTAAADFDADGDLDIAVLGFYVIYNQSVEEKLVILKNNGAASPTQWDFEYIDIPLGDLTSGASDMAWGDFDGDGYPDLVVGSNGVTVIYRNDAGTLVLTDTELPGYYEDNFQADFDLRSITVADYDNDGDLDILLPSVFDFSSSTFRTALMRNDGLNQTGGWNFTEIQAGFSPTSHAQTQWADNDGDQDLDLLIVNIVPLTDDGFIRIYRNDGNGNFVGEDVLGDLTVEHGEIQWGDYDNDGDLDILVAGNIKELSGIYRDVLRIYRNDDSVYTPFEVIENIHSEGWYDLNAATWADYDSDGNMDILVAGTYNSGSQIEGRARIYINDGNGNFAFTNNELPAPRSMGDRGGTFSWFDIDADGDLDYFIAGFYFVPGGNGLVEAQMHVYRNDVDGQNNAPTTPTGLEATIHSDNTVLLTWNPSTDDHTPSAALTYDLIIVRKGKHTPSDLSIARLPEPGNVSAVNEWSFTGLPDGEYEWILSAVDAAYVGSIQAVGEFSIGVTSAGTSDQLPVSYSLEQNYPNPFNPATTIRYSIPEENPVTIKVYNTLGEQVLTIVNEVQSAGVYQITFNPIGLASGVYFYRIEAGSFVQVKKMILNK